MKRKTQTKPEPTRPSSPVVSVANQIEVIQKRRQQINRRALSLQTELSNLATEGEVLEQARLKLLREFDTAAQ